MPDLETEAMGHIIAAFDGLDAGARGRVLRWAMDRFEIAVGPPARTQRVQDSTLTSVRSGEANEGVTDEEPTDLATLYAATNPKTQADKALVVGYWLQAIGGAADWESQVLNTELKNLGYGLKNVTDALNTLIKQNPKLVIQTRKSGTTKQARKRYKLTVEGIKRVRSMASGGRNGDHDG